MKGTEKIYDSLVNRVPGIQERYRHRRKHADSSGKRVLAWISLLGWNFSYYVLRNRRLGESRKYPYYEEKVLYSRGSESSLSYMKPPEDFARELSGADVISFDVFDTLVFRPFGEPTDLFFMVGEKLGYPDFKRIRMEMEERARRIKYRKRGTHEVTLEQIYELMERECGIDGKTAMQMETEEEYRYCFANPYMKQMVKALRKQGKRLIITSDMYLREEHIRQILRRSGYDEFDGYYVSCEQGSSKSRGDLYDIVRREETIKYRRKTACQDNVNTKSKPESRKTVKQEIGKQPETRRQDGQGSDGLKFAHIGDNPVSDERMAKEHGFEAHIYRNVNTAGAAYRAEDMSSITGGIYRGLVNAHIHNGLSCYSREYEYGYIYGGLFVAGYCQFIHEYVKEHAIDKILFLARDGDILSKAYHILYSEEDESWEYVYWSRLAATKMAAGKFKYDYFRRFLYHKVNQGYSLEEILASMELEDMGDGSYWNRNGNQKESGSAHAARSVGLYRETGLAPEAELNDSNVDKVKEYLLNHWPDVLAHYRDQLEAGKEYFAPILRGCRRATAVDIGWAGSGAITLDHIVREIWGMGCEITGIVAGTNTCRSDEPDSSEAFLQSGKQVSYLYSQRENRDLWKLHDPGKDHNLYWEMLLDAPSGSLKGFYPGKDGGWECRFKEASVDTQKVQDVQCGVLEFVREWNDLERKWKQKAMDGKFSSPGDIKPGVDDSERSMFRISGRDAYAPMVSVLDKKNWEFCAQLKEQTDIKNLE